MLALGACLLLLPAAHAGLFDDDEARKAILDLRQKQDQAAARQAETGDQIKQLRGSLLDLNTQLEQLRGEIAKLRGQNEQLARDLSEVQRRQQDLKQGFDDRVRKLEPQKVTVDGKEFLTDPEEKRQYDEAFATLRKGDFAAGAAALSTFKARYPASGYNESVTFWLGNAQYGQKAYKEAIASFRALVTMAPDNPHASEALLSIANCQLELKDRVSARRTLNELLKNYPKSEAAQAGRERLAALK
ncbi:MAG TPA: tol-pal system protein YbgF [Methylibium sp.]